MRSARRWNNNSVAAYIEQQFRDAPLELIAAAKEADSKRAFLARRAVRMLSAHLSLSLSLSLSL